MGGRGDIWPTTTPGPDSDKYDDQEEEPEPYYFYSIQEPIIKPKDSTFRGASKSPFCIAEDDKYQGSSSLTYNTTPIREDPNISQ